MTEVKVSEVQFLKELLTIVIEPTGDGDAVEHKIRSRLKSLGKKSCLDCDYYSNAGCTAERCTERE